MYESFYGFNERPFNLTPDPRYLFLSEKHKEAFAHLLFGLKNKMGFVMVTGEIGTGKTTICRALLSQLDSNTEVAFIFNPCLDPVELIKRILQEFGVQTTANTLLELTDQLNRFLLEKSKQGKNCVLVIDEAQNLTPSVLEQIRLLSNLETEKEKLLQIILIGQPELLEVLNLHELRQLNQRISARYHLNPLDEQETKQYIYYRLHIAGGKKKVNITPKALKLIYKYTNGVPRLINSLCDRALLIGYTKETKTIDHKIISQAYDELQGQFKLPTKTIEKKNIWRNLIPSPVVIVIFILIFIALGVWMSPIEKVLNLAEVPEGQNHQVLKEKETNSTQNAQQPMPIDTKNLTKILWDDLTKKFGGSNENGSEKRKEEDIFVNVDPNVARINSMLLLLRLWNIAQLRDESLNNDSVEGIVQFFNDNGLSTEVWTSKPESIFAFGLPALVKIKDGEKSLWCLLIKEENKNILLFLTLELNVKLSKERFYQLYDSVAIIPWKDYMNFKLLAPGSSGPQVKQMKNLLQKGGWLSKDNITDIYDADTQQAVRRLQEQLGLRADGIIGKQVRFALTQFSSEHVPTIRNTPPFLADLLTETLSLL